jgi:ATP-dependent DNA helicase RecG
MWIRQPYIAKLIQNDSLVKVVGKVSMKNGNSICINPKIESIASIPAHSGSPLFNQKDTVAPIAHCSPAYAETKGITSLWFYHAFKKVFADARFSLEFNAQSDPIPDEIRQRYHLPALHTALVWIHGPQKIQDAEVAKKRFAFEEIFFIQIRSQIEKKLSMQQKSFVIADHRSVDQFTDRLGFSLTESQQQSIEDILKDMKREYPMSRLLEGDVGSGKTAVAAAASYAVVKERPKNQKSGTLQVAYMAPTEILAKQHFESFIALFRHLPISIGLITGKECRKFPSKVNPNGWTNISRSQLSKWVANGEIAIVIGTHALIQKNVNFKHLALVVIDEQHRFGTNQRQKLAKKHDRTPHLLSMTATPIPRTLALTLYGDLDLSILDQMPTGRKKVETKIVKPEEHTTAYDHIRSEIEAGRQAYIICPRIEDSDEDEIKLARQNPMIDERTMAIKMMKSVTGEAKRLKKEVFPEFNIGILHGKMKPLEKEKVMNAFLSHEIDILVATSVVEVGVNVPNASIILIEHAERYGLSQLHQLRGRVIRGNHQPYCYLATDTKSESSLERLEAIKTAKNGFELAELDLSIRGVGELYGAKQWGVSDIAMDAIRNLKMVEAARKEAASLVSEDMSLGAYPRIKSRLDEQKEVHFE